VDDAIPLDCTYTPVYYHYAFYKSASPKNVGIFLLLNSNHHHLEFAMPRHSKIKVQADDDIEQFESPADASNSKLARSRSGSSDDGSTLYLARIQGTRSTHPVSSILRQRHSRMGEENQRQGDQGTLIVQSRDGSTCVSSLYARLRLHPPRPGKASSRTPQRGTERGVCAQFGSFHPS
jgi:hypothetical protein